MGLDFDIPRAVSLSSSSDPRIVIEKIRPDIDRGRHATARDPLLAGDPHSDHAQETTPSLPPRDSGRERGEGIGIETPKAGEKQRRRDARQWFDPAPAPAISLRTGPTDRTPDRARQA
jgi:hypothetical protein